MKGLAHHNPEEAEAIARRLRQIKGYLWNGNLHDGQLVIENLVFDSDEIETDYASIKALRKAASEFEIYIANNAGIIPNDAERRRNRESVSTGFVEKAPSTPSSASTSVNASRCAGQSKVHTSCFKPEPGRLTGRFEVNSSKGIRE